MSAKINQILKALGLTEGETKTYLAALKLGPSSVLSLSKESGLTKQSTYNATERLNELGLLDSEQQEKLKVFFTKQPRRLLDFAKAYQAEIATTVQDLKDLLPMLELEAGGDKPSVHFFEGDEGFRKAVMMAIKSGENVGYEMIDTLAFHSTIPKKVIAEIRQHMAKGKKRDVMLLGTSDLPKPMVKMVREYVQLPDKDKDHRSHIGIYGDVIVMVAFRDKPQVVIVRDSILSDALKLLFKYSAKYLQQ